MTAETEVRRLRRLGDLRDRLGLSTGLIHEIKHAAEVLACMRNPNSWTYVAIPITGGPRYVEWCRTNEREGGSRSLADAVIRPNCEAAKRSVQEINKTFGGVIDPSALYFKGWSQSDYRFFWSLVIEQYAARAVFLDGWPLSTGCAFEFLVASYLDIPTFTATGAVLTLDQGVDAVQQGVLELAGVNGSSEFLKRVATELVLLRSRCEDARRG